MAISGQPDFLPTVFFTRQRQFSRGETVPPLLKPLSSFIAQQHTMSSNERSVVGKVQSAKRQKRNDQDWSPVKVATAPSLSSLGDPLVVVLTFLEHKELWKLEETCRHFREVCQEQWRRLDAKIPASRIAARTARNRPQLPKIRVAMFNRLSQFAKRMEYQSRLHPWVGSQCEGCDYPDLASECIDSPDVYDWFIRLIILDESQLEEESIIWEGFVNQPAEEWGHRSSRSQVRFDFGATTADLVSTWSGLSAMGGLSSGTGTRVHCTIAAINCSTPPIDPLLVFSKCAPDLGSSSRREDGTILVRFGNNYSRSHTNRLASRQIELCFQFRDTPTPGLQAVLTFHPRGYI